VIAAALWLAAAGGASGRESLGVWGAWGAFRDAAPRRCFAVSTPARTGAHPAWRPFASVASWPGAHRRQVLFVRLSAPRAPDATITLSVGERRFRLAGRGSGSWSPDPATDRAVIAALRGERSMSIETVSANGRAFADTYMLVGAATAIDAATLGCLG
jgi:hypothetical protein